ncbi:MAG: DinB family protein [Chloroflexi bacterium]|nr:MAG: DinB family protein [Chloroflexota bacterium]
MADETQIAELSQKMISERETLLAALESLSDDEAGQPPKDGEWNAKQQMSHLCEMESAYRAWVARALEEDGANVEGIRGERVAIPLEEADRHTVAEHLAEMRGQREKTMALIASMTPSDFDRRASNSLFGSLTVMQWLRSYYRHDRMHVDQISGLEPSYKPQFASGREPDQRRAQPIK